MYDTYDDTVVQLFGAAYILMLLLYLAITVFMLYVGARIIRKAGWSGWWVLMLFVPVANIVMFIIFAFTTWPVEEENKALRARTFGPRNYPTLPGEEFTPRPF